MNLEQPVDYLESTPQCVNSDVKKPATVLNHGHHNNALQKGVEVMEQPVSDVKTSSTTKLATETGMDPAPLFMKLRIGFAATGVFVGLSILICFQADPNLTNLHIALWGLASACFAAMTLLVHIAHLRWNRDKWVYRLKAGILLGFIVQAGCVVAFLTYIILAAVENQPLYPLNNSGENDKGYYVAAVWVFMTWKWSFVLFWYSRAYRKVYITRYETIP